MATIARAAFSDTPVDSRFWPQLASVALRWTREREIALRDVVLLVPYAQLLAPARRAFAQHGGWQPRIETTQTLARSIAPPPPLQSGQLRFDAASDRLAGGALLQRHAWAAAWARRDPRSFEQAVAALVSTAHELARAAAAVPPPERVAYWDAARDRLAPLQGPGATERLLARVALEWAAATESAPTDVLFGCRPAAWIVVQTGGEEPLVVQLLAAAKAPCLVLDADPPDTAPFDAVAALPPPRALLCEGFEGEAQATAAEVLHALGRGAAPVALIAHDRELMRRVRALLERAGVALRDETGWKLSTTRAAARVMALLRAAHPRAGADARLDWLKGEAVDPFALRSLEASWRRGGAANDAADTLWRAQRARLEPVAGAARQPLAAWQAVLRGALDTAALESDAAGRQVMAALQWEAGSDAAWQALAEATLLDLDGFTAWVDAALEQASFVPPQTDDAAVVITPLARALLRPFGAVVFAGTDERRLGAPAASPSLLGDALARELGVPDGRERRRRETLAFAQLLRAPELVLLRRRSDGAEPLGASVLVERAQLARRRAGFAPWQEEPATLPRRRVPRRPVMRPAPPAPNALPPSLSASAVEALRDCPYRFFARVQLGLAEIPELEAALEKRDYGTWLHAVLHRFHEERGVPQPLELEVDALLALADQLQQEQGLDAAELLPYRTALERLAPLYVEWLHERDVEGWGWAEGETKRDLHPPALAGTGLHGRIDRIDRLGGTLQLIDYKTGSAADLKKKVKTPLEDTQLAFYAALARGDRALLAIYLALDERDGPQAIEHADIETSAQALVEGLAQDLAKIRAGAGLAALGEGRLCERCEARALCRRDHWDSEAFA
jgi:ATP-dependent helicase/nuclease subunit B